MKFLDRNSSRQYSQVMEEIMRSNLRKESHASMPKSKSRSSFRVFTEDPMATSNFKTVIPSTDEKKEEKVKEKAIS
jgi:hypothetical protein